MHARNEECKADIIKDLPNSTVVIWNLSDKQGVFSVAKQVSELGTFDVIAHNAGVYDNNQKISVLKMRCFLEKQRSQN